jgi:hypothetical protein
LRQGRSLREKSHQPDMLVSANLGAGTIELAREEGWEQTKTSRRFRQQLRRAAENERRHERTVGWRAAGGEKQIVVSYGGSRCNTTAGSALFPV